MLDRIFAEYPDIAAIVHCAAFIVVPESVANPLRYYRNNVGKTIELLGHLHRLGCHRLLFSSSPRSICPGRTSLSTIVAHRTRLPVRLDQGDGRGGPARSLRRGRDGLQLARAHVQALERFDEILPDGRGYDVINVGTGRGTTVRELLSAFEAAVGAKLDVVETGPRPGDVVASYTRNDKARSALGWSAELSIPQAVRDAVECSAIRESVLNAGSAPG